MPTTDQPSAGRGVPPKPRFAWLGFIIVVGAGALFIWVFLVTRHPPTRLVLHTCFKNAQGLQADAPVRLAGVPVGFVSNVQAKPENRDCPASVDMKLTTSYDLKIPRDSIASIETAGVLGQDFIEIDIADALDPPIRNGGTLRSIEKPQSGPKDILDLLESRSKSNSPATAQKSEPSAVSSDSDKKIGNNKKR